MRSGAPASVEIPGLPLRAGAALMLGATALLPLIPEHTAVICPMRLAFGIPCPLCGMTTSITEAGRGRFDEALAANPAGLVAIVGALLVLALRPDRVRLPALPFALAFGAMWLFELERFSIL